MLYLYIYNSIRVYDYTNVLISMFDIAYIVVLEVKTGADKNNLVYVSHFMKHKILA